jgi:hypothetical protein
MDIKVTEKTGRVPVTVFQLDGRINIGTADDLRQRAKDIFDSGFQNLLLDLTQVKSLTSEGLRAIHFIYNLFLVKEPKDAKEDTKAVAVEDKPEIVSTQLWTPEPLIPPGEQSFGNEHPR